MGVAPGINDQHGFGVLVDVKINQVADVGSHVGAEFLVVSQFTLYADMSRRRRPGFTGAAPPAVAAPLVDRCVELLRGRGFKVETGQFGVMMDVELTNHGPVTIVLSNDGW